MPRPIIVKTQIIKEDVEDVEDGAEKDEEYGVEVAPVVGVMPAKKVKSVEPPSEVVVDLRGVAIFYIEPTESRGHVLMKHLMGPLVDPRQVVVLADTDSLVL